MTPQKEPTMNLSTALALTVPATSRATRPLLRWMHTVRAAMTQRRNGAAHSTQQPARAHTLAQGDTLVIDDAHGQVVICQSGCAWITYDRQPMDSIVQAGEQHQVYCQSRMLVHAVSDVRLTVSPLPPVPQPASAQAA